MKEIFIDIEKYSSVVNDLENLSRYGLDIEDDLLRIHKIYPMFGNDYYLNLIEQQNSVNDPIYKQSIPNYAELDNSLELKSDGLGESRYLVVEKMLHHYSNRVLIITNNQCATYCRFCFRKRLWKGNKKQYLTEGNLEKICEYLAKNLEVTEVLLSGGDPLMLNNSYLKMILDKLNRIEHLDVIRVCTRMPVTLPQRIDIELVDIFKQQKNIWILTHFNHPNEITSESIEACQLFINSGIPVLNQTVLLKGINDDSDVLAKLFSQLVKIKVKPHYLFHIDPVAGASHFATGVERGLQIVEELRSKISSLAMPTYAIDLPNGAGKVALLPNYINSKKQYKTFEGNYVDYPF